MSHKLMGKKRGMTQIFDEKGNIIACTVIEAEPNIVTQIKTKENDGYEAIQLGFDKIRVKDPRTIEKRVSQPLRGHFAKNNIEPRRYLAETKIEENSSFTIGQEINVAVFANEKYLDVTATSKGKGHQGVMKRYHFAGGPASHGSGFHRHGGSTGQRSSPGRRFPQQKQSGHMGNEQVTVQNLRLVRVDEANNVLLVEGAVPGPKNGLVYVSPAKKKKKTK